ncbi:pao retrotransposon peptidase [Lasius niger]|uniref:Pao retrotransposon peptidase n=1 Tax=Lasius niger TaxID=67767 RepID=A0A0J7KI23_LASNI|nr:pao retrotransposon peptidase [Lasius niger]
MHLPKIAIPKFSGDAAHVIQSLEINAENYEEALQLLKQRYDDKRIIAQEHIKALFDLPVITKGNYNALRQLIDHVLRHLRSLKGLNRPTEQWDDLIIHMISTRLDISTIKEWEDNIRGEDMPTLKQMTDFLSHKCKALSAISKRNPCDSQNSNIRKNITKGTHVSTANIHCSHCKGKHHIFQCDSFLKLPPEDRYKAARDKGLCINCLRSTSHQARDSRDEEHQVVLSTALIEVYDRRGRTHRCRALLDSGSQINFITRRLAEELDLVQGETNMTITGINQAQTHSRRITNVFLKINDLKIPNNIRLADPQFHVPAEIDMLIGAEIFWQLLCIGQVYLHKDQPMLQKTQLVLTKFWNIECVNNVAPFTPEENYCMEHYTKSTIRDENGRFIVSMPIKNEKLLQLGESKDTALKRFLSLEPVRAMHNLAEIEAVNYPIGSATVFNDFYMDDLLTGANTKSEAKQIRDQTTMLLEKGGFQLRKWASNCSDLLKDIPHSSMNEPIYFIDNSEKIRTLGIQWNIKEDTFQYAINTISRQVTSRETPSQVQIHGFSDASERAYGACIYIRTTDQTGQHFSHLICSKSRVAPLKYVTLPRLELCGALLLAQLIEKVLNSLQIQTPQVYYWTDSTIVLHWIKAVNKKWSIFVANRISEIHQLSSMGQWYHVGTNFNPADHVSRGLLPLSLIDSKLWWHGPSWLVEDSRNWNMNIPAVLSPEVPEQIICKPVMVVTTNNYDLFDRFSSFTKLIRTIAWSLRFVHNSRNKIEDRRTGRLTTQELNDANLCIVKIIQKFL